MAPAREDIAKSLVGQVNKSKSWQWTWIVENQKEKLMPVALAVTSQKQVVVKSNSKDPL